MRSTSRATRTWASVPRRPFAASWIALSDRPMMCFSISAPWRIACPAIALRAVVSILPLTTLNTTFVYWFQPARSFFNGSALPALVAACAMSSTAVPWSSSARVRLSCANSRAVPVMSNWPPWMRARNSSPAPLRSAFIAFTTLRSRNRSAGPEPATIERNPASPTWPTSQRADNGSTAPRNDRPAVRMYFAPGRLARADRLLLVEPFGGGLRHHRELAVPGVGDLELEVDRGVAPRGLMQAMGATLDLRLLRVQLLRDELGVGAGVEEVPQPSGCAAS
jgi:hypothetical protein